MLIQLLRLIFLLNRDISAQVRTPTGII